MTHDPSNSRNEAPRLHRDDDPELLLLGPHGTGDDWTRQWWDDHRGDCELFTSEAVIEELEQGEYPHRADCLELIEGIALLPIDDAILDIVDVYINRHVMPADPFGDALHLALASYHRCDILLTWNCRHLANVNKFAHIRRINVMLDLFVPTLTTPLEFLGEEEP